MSDKELYQAVKKYSEANRMDTFTLAKDMAIMESIIQTQTLRINELEQAVQTLEKLYKNLAYAIAQNKTDN